MKAAPDDHAEDDMPDPSGRKRRFRFNRRQMDDELQQLDDLADQVHQLEPVASGPATPAPDRTDLDLAGAARARRDDGVSEAALEALATLDSRVRSGAPLQPAGGAQLHPGDSNAAWAEPRQPAPAGAAPAAAAPPSPSPTTMPPALSQAGPAPGHETAQVAVQPAPPAPAPDPVQHTAAGHFPEATTVTSTHPASFHDTDLQGGAGDAVLVPTSPAPAAADMWHDGGAPVTASGSRQPGHTSRGGMLVDVNRIIRTLEEEAEAAHQRIDHELGRARQEADAIVREATADADHIREHAQQQARVLLGEVEEIITDAQRTGQQILRKADAEAEDVRRQAGDLVMEAQGEARKIIETARREGEQILAEQGRLATVRAQEALREQERLKEQIHRLEERRRQVLESLEPLIDQLSQMIPAARNVVDFPAGGSSMAARR